MNKKILIIDSSDEKQLFSSDVLDIVIGKSVISSENISNNDISYLSDKTIKNELTILNDYLDFKIIVIKYSFDFKESVSVLSVKKIKKLVMIKTLDIYNIIKRFNDVIIKNQTLKIAIILSIDTSEKAQLYLLHELIKDNIVRLIEFLNQELYPKSINDKISIIILEEKALNNKGGLENIVQRQDKKLRLIRIGLDGALKKVTENEKLVNELNTYISNSKIVVGYMGGTYDLFHIGHLNILKKAKLHCDFLIVGVHKDVSHKNKETFISYEERFEIVNSIKYIDKTVESCSEDADFYNVMKFNYLFIGDDWKGSERFARYEKYFEDKGAQIIYFPYTKSTSSTKLRELIDIKISKG